MHCNSLCNLLAMAKKLLPDDGSRPCAKPSQPAVATSRYKQDSPFFHSPRHGRDFAVHPDWVSESLVPKTEQPYPFSARAQQHDVTKPSPRGRSMSRRAASANGVHRDPITWRNWYFMCCKCTYMYSCYMCRMYVYTYDHSCTCSVLVL